MLYDTDELMVFICNLDHKRSYNVKMPPKFQGNTMILSHEKTSDRYGIWVTKHGLWVPVLGVYFVFLSNYLGSKGCNYGGCAITLSIHLTIKLMYLDFTSMIVFS